VAIDKARCSCWWWIARLDYALDEELARLLRSTVSHFSCGEQSRFAAQELSGYFPPFRGAGVPDHAEHGNRVDDFARCAIALVLGR